MRAQRLSNRIARALRRERVKKTISSSSDLLAGKKHFPYEKDEEIEDEFGRMERKKSLYILHMCAKNNNTDCRSSVWI